MAVLFLNFGNQLERLVVISTALTKCRCPLRALRVNGTSMHVGT